MATKQKEPKVRLVPVVKKADKSKKTSTTKK